MLQCIEVVKLCEDVHSFFRYAGIRLVLDYELSAQNDVQGLGCSLVQVPGLKDALLDQAQILRPRAENPKLRKSIESNAAANII